jgi:hypothetical protein
MLKDVLNSLNAAASDIAAATAAASSPASTSQVANGGNARNYTRTLEELGGGATSAATRPGDGIKSEGGFDPVLGGMRSPSPSTVAPKVDHRKRLADLIAGEKGKAAETIAANEARAAERAAEAAARAEASPWQKLSGGLSDAFKGPVREMPSGIMDAFRNAQKAAQESMGGWNGKGGSTPADAWKAFTQAGGAGGGGIFHRLLGMMGGGEGGPGGAGGGAGAAGEGAATFRAGLPGLLKGGLKGGLGTAISGLAIGGQIVGGLASVGSAATRNITDPHSKPLQAAGDMAEAGIGAAGGIAGAVIGSAFGPVGTIIGGIVGKTIVEPIGKVIGGLIGAPEKIKEFGEALIQNTERLRRFDAGINATHALMERQQLQLDRHQAMATSGSTQNLGKHLMALRAELQPISEDWANVQNNIAAITAAVAVFAVKGAPFMEGVLEHVMGTHGALKWIWKLLAKSEPGKGGNAYLSFLGELSKSGWSTHPNHPKNKRPGEQRP